MDPDLTQSLATFAGGRYALVRLIGAGAEKVVYLARDRALDRDCALAVLRAEHLSDDAADRFRAEARAIARLGPHPHVVTLFDMGTHDGANFLVSEHLAGGDLTRALQDAGGRLPLAEVVAMARQILYALEFIHKCGIVHGDLKPDNVWLTPEGVVKIGDFGIAQAPTGPERQGPLLGTLGYMSPEHLRGETLDGRSDLYALGCLMFQLLTGAPPYTGTARDIIAGHLSDPVPPLAGTAASGPIEPILAALLAKRREDRPASAAEVLRRFDDMQMGGTAAGTPAPAAESRWLEPFQEALSRHDAGAAAGVLQATLATEADPEARLALGRLLLVADPAAARKALELSVQEFIATGRPKRAAVAAAAVATSYASGDGNRIAANPWLQRAWRLVRDEGPCLERGWVAIFDIACNTDDPRVLRENCDIALEMARRFGDEELEAKALADGGCALTQLGEVEEGTLRMDEALAMTTSGQIRDFLVAAEIMCAFFTSVASSGDLGRCEAWSRVFRERGMVGGGAHPITTSHCNSVYGGLLCRLGRFSEAESTLMRAIEDARATIYAGRLHSLSNLAELRIQQRRFAEAEELLRGHDDFVETLIPKAHLHLARGAFDAAAATARTVVRKIGADRTRAVSLLCILVEAELGRGNLVEAQAAGALLDERVADSCLPALTAEAACVRARLRIASGDRAGAIAVLEAAVNACASVQIGPLSARLHLALARLHGETDPGAALVEANAAASILARLDVVIPDDDLSFLRATGAWPLPQ